MEGYPMFSVIIPVYNSEKTLRYTLKSIRSQSIDQSKVEILIVDGGSEDSSLDIAEEYGARVIYNKRRLPEFAKHQGMMAANGRYGIFIDSDEAFTNRDSLVIRLRLIERYSSVKNIVSTGQICQKGESGVTRYANFIGDPFSNFVYRYNGYNRIEDLTAQYHHKDIGDGILLDFSNCKFLPLFDALGNMFDIDAARKMCMEAAYEQSFAANIFSNMTQKTKCAIVMKNDFICHRPNLTKKIYLGKLRWRIKNNLFQTEGVGFAQRSRKERGLQKRKLLFIPYCALVLPVLFDAVRLAVKNRDLYFLNHFWYAEYTFILILWYVALKLVNYPVKMDKTYGK